MQHIIRIFLVLTLLFTFSALSAQHNFNAIITDHETNDPLPGVTVFFSNLNKGAASDINGNVFISGIPEGSYTVRISYVGYETLSKEINFPMATSPLQIELKAVSEEMEEVVIRSTRSSRSIQDNPTRVEFIAGEELAEKGNMKPGDIRMLLNESTGIRTQQTSATSYNSSIRIQGLDGKYTQLLRDGLPLYSGFSGGLSLMQIAPLDLKQVEVIKGASSTLYGGGAIAGLVNLITKTPEEYPELSFMVNGTSALGLDVSGFYSEKYGKIGTTVFASYNKGTPYDPADIGLTAIPKFDRFTLNPKLFFYPDDNTELNLGVNLVTEDRLGGNMDFVEGKDIQNAYFERNETDRISTQFQLDHSFNNKTQLVVKNSLNIYNRLVEVPGFSFGGKQFSSFSEANISWQNNNLEWIAGVNLWTNEFDQEIGGAESLGFANSTIGGFAQNIWTMSETWTLETGFRLDYQSDYGTFPLPRFSLMYEPSPELTFRVGGGLGYKSPTVFSEEAERRQFQNIQPINPEALEAERSLGSNLDVNYRIPITDELSLSSNILFFYTQIDQPLFLSATGNSTFEFAQSQGYIDTRGVEVNLKLSYHHLKLFVGYTHANVQQHANGTSTEFPLVANHRLNNVLMFEKHDNFWIGLEAYYYSPQKLSDGSIGQSYWIAGLMTEKKLGEHFSIFLNFENFLDTRQTAFDTIYTGSLSDPQFRDIYAPVDGFVINGGFKWKL